MNVSLYFYDTSYRPTRSDAPPAESYGRVLCRSDTSTLGTVCVSTGKNEIRLGAVAFNDIADMSPSVNLSYLIATCLSLLQSAECDEDDAMDELDALATIGKRAYVRRPAQVVKLYIHPPTLFDRFLNYTNPKNRYLYYKQFIPAPAVLSAIVAENTKFQFLLAL